MSYDNTCKFLAENYPTDFARWLLTSDTSDIQVRDILPTLTLAGRARASLPRRRAFLLHWGMHAQPSSAGSITDCPSATNIRPRCITT
ncbi:hypothetical protein BZZ01_28190 [Nostocales cyanobacterium HT-58-2]|nr:hypothetical protein BZZ01_28190 [Nostocales cyanobacterium HT-58-2]